MICTRKKLRPLCLPAFFEPLETRTLFSVPAAPSDLTVKTSGTTVELHWKDNSNVESSYVIYRGTSSSNLQKIGTIAKNSTSYNTTIPSTNTTYYYDIRADNSDALSKEPSVVSAKVSSSSSSTSSSSSSTTKTATSSTSAAVSVPAAPSDLTVKTSGTTVELNWKDNSNVETNYIIYSGTSNTNLQEISTIGKNSTSDNTTIPKTNTTYYYDIRADNSGTLSKEPAVVSVKVSSSSSSSTSTSTSTSTKTTTSSTNVIHIGPNEAIKSLANVSWPSASAAPVTFVLDSSSKPYQVSKTSIYGNVTIEAADPNNKPTLELPSSFKVDSGGGYTADGASFTVYGTFTIRDMNITGGGDTVLLGSEPGANILSEDITTDGGAIWRGSGLNDGTFIDSVVVGNPRANVFSNYDNTANKVVIDNTATNVAIPQGGRIINGNPIGEAAIRMMDVNNLTMIHVATKPWFYKSGEEWKQDVQLRPSSGSMTLEDCTFYQADIGDMTWRARADPINYVELDNCTMTLAPHITDGVKEVKLVDCIAAGKKISETLT